MAAINNTSHDLLAGGALMEWFPDWRAMYEDLTQMTPLEPEFFKLSGSFRGMEFAMSPSLPEEGGFFHATYWSQATGNHWEIPLITVFIYLVSIPLLSAYVEKYGKWDVRNFAFYWNASLSIFSWCGVFVCVPMLAKQFWEYGLYYTCCAPAAWYGSGASGLFVALFIYSKIVELIDTVLLILSAKPVIALQWWHHFTVLLYCWHSYTVRIGTGLWFAAMNYAVHSVMYGYFAIMGTKYRKYVRPYAIYVTFMQLMQMVVGMYVTVKAVIWQATGETCHVNKTNSIMGLLMYLSYFVLFFKLFVENYCLRKRPSAETATEKKQHMTRLEPSSRQVADAAGRAVTRRIAVFGDTDSSSSETARQRQSQHQVPSPPATVPKAAVASSADRKKED